MLIWLPVRLIARKLDGTVPYQLLFSGGGRTNNRKESGETGSLERSASSQDGGDKYIRLVANASMNGIALMNAPESIIIHQQRSLSPYIEECCSSPLTA